MDVTLIGEDNLQYFERLLYPETVRTLRAGQPILALGAVDNGMACGALAGWPEGDVFIIQSIFVTSSCRGRGAGKALLDELVRLCSFLPELEKIRCSFTISCEDHKKLSDYLGKQGFHFEDIEDGVVSVPLSALQELAFYRNTNPAFRAYALSELSDRMLRGLDKRLTTEAGPVLQQPLEKAPLERDLSTATLAGTSIDGCLLFEKSGDGRLALRYADAGANQSGGVFTSLLLKSYQMAIKKYPPDTEVLIQPVTELSQALVKRLAPNARGISVDAVRLL